jgi:hypothetical protein
MYKYGIVPADAYNMDETGFRIGVGGSQWAVTMNWERKQMSGSETNRDYITSMEAISGDGEVLPPLLIAQGSVHLQKSYTHTSLLDNYAVGLSKSGYAIDTLSLEWLKHFDLHSAKRQVGAWTLLIFDGYGSHCTLEFWEYCDSKKIICFALPPHTSQDLQPLDVVVFQPYKHYQRAAVEAATRTGCTDFNKPELLNAIDSIRAQTFTQSTILSSWAKAGIFPWNPERVLQKVRARQPRSPSSPPRSPGALGSDILLKTPTTVRTFKRELAAIKFSILKKQRVTPAQLKRVFKSAAVMADSRAIAETELTYITAVAKARQKRQAAGQKQVQKGGVLTGAMARAAVDAREEADAIKVGRKAQLQYKRDLQRTKDAAAEDL